MPEKPVTSVKDLTDRILTDTIGPATHQPWFRGEPDVDTALTPRLYRKSASPRALENQLLQNFRIMAPSFVRDVPIPPRGDTDQWLCLAQHVRLPTRLLDWTESALLALFFALRESQPVVWMLEPIELNILSDELNCKRIRETGEFPITWLRPDEPPLNPVAENIAGAWQDDQVGVQLPVAFVPPYVHPRMAAQRSRFTVQGRSKASLSALLPSTILKRYKVDPQRRTQLKHELRILGVAHATAFPDLDGLATELTHRYAPWLT